MNTITLIDGRTVSRDNIRFEPSSQRFYLEVPGLTSEDITSDVYRADKNTFSGFDVELDNIRLSNERATGVINTGEIPGPLNDSTASIFLQQITTDPLAAPLETLDNTAKQIFGSFGIQTILIVAAIALFFWMGGLQMLKGTLKK